MRNETIIGYCGYRIDYGLIHNKELYIKIFLEYVCSFIKGGGGIDLFLMYYGYELIKYYSEARLEHIAAKPLACRHQIEVSSWENLLLHKVEYLPWLGLIGKETFISDASILELDHHKFVVANKYRARTIAIICSLSWLLTHLNKKIVNDNWGLRENCRCRFSSGKVAHITQTKDILKLVVL